MSIPPQAIIFDFDGVLLESEYEGNRLIAEALSDSGHPTTVEDALIHFVGLNGQDFIDAVEKWIGTGVPPDFQVRMSAERRRVLREGLIEVAGAVDFVQSLPPSIARAVASSSSVQWIETHLEHLGLADAFGDHIYSGRDHVERGKPAPDLYLYAARQLGVPIEQSVILEDSTVGVTGAVASGATVIGFVGGSHCLDGQAERLQALGVHHIARSFDEVRELLGLA
jgi:HAD superfamily hydrolase (TIGR01509 family)